MLLKLSIPSLFYHSMVDGSSEGPTIMGQTKTEIERIKAELFAKSADWNPCPPGTCPGPDCMNEVSSWASIKILNGIAVTGSSVVYNAEVLSWPNNKRKLDADDAPIDAPVTDKLVVKYTNDCLERQGLVNGEIVTEHPLIREYSILSALKTSGVVPKAFHVSGPLKLPTASACPRIVPGRFDRPEEYKKCQELGTEVRFLVQEKVGPTVDKYIKHLEGKLDGSSENDLKLLRAVLIIARKTFYMIQRLHLHGIVHGDIHGSNIAFTDIDVDFDTVDISQSSFVMIDFGLAVFYPDDYGSSSISPPGNELSNWLLSPWQLLNFRKGRRDDIIRTVDFVASALSKGRLHKGFKALVGDGSVSERRSAASEIKFLLPVFRPSSLLKSEAMFHLKSISLEKKRQIQSTLELLRSWVLMQHSHPDSAVDYLRIDFEFVNLLNQI